MQVESLEEKWKECNDEYVEVFLLVAEVVFDQMVQELVDDLTAIQSIKSVN
jgi:hypothetical protein